MAEFSQMAEIHPLRGRILPYLWQISHNGYDFVMAEICLLTHLLIIMHKLYDDLLIDFITLQKCFFMFPRIPQSTLVLLCLESLANSLVLFVLK